MAEPLTGRKNEYHLLPFSLEELRSYYSDLEMHRLLKQWMVFGFYPEVVLREESREKRLKEISLSYAYKDILKYQDIKNPEILEKLLQALALRVGNEVSYNELASLLSIDKKTVGSYVRILEQAFIIFRLKPLRRNLRNELRKLRKIYFFDIGLRNALINNLNPLDLRQDRGAIFENFFIVERLKFLQNNGVDVRKYFWRTTDTKKEIDYLEEANGKFVGFEIKFQKQKFRTPLIFLKSYLGSKINLVNVDNFWEWV